MASHQNFSIRLANEKDIRALEILIPLSVRSLQLPYYSSAQMEAAIGPVFGVDRLLIRDGTFFVVEHSGTIVGCGGWSRRRAISGGDRERAGEDAFIDRACDPARVRAFFVHPDWARRGIGRLILSTCESAIYKAGFRNIVLIATLAGEPLYAANGYTQTGRYDIPMGGHLNLPVVRMVKTLPDIA